MFKVKVFTVGRSKEGCLSSAIQEYEKRLTGHLCLEWHFAKTNAQLLQWSLVEPAIVLDPQGTLLTSEEWAAKMPQLGLRLRFIIGGADGLPIEIKQKARFLWSLSPLTFTHEMTRLILVEQLYRAIEIGRSSRYHK